MSRQIRESPAPAPPAGPDQHDLGSTDETIDLMVRWFREFGDTYRVYAPGRKSWTWVVHDPEDIKRVLVTNHRNYTKGVGIDRVKLLLGNGIMTSEGEFWRLQRRMMQPAFHRKVIEKFSARIRTASAMPRRLASRDSRGRDSSSRRLPYASEASSEAVGPARGSQRLEPCSTMMRFIFLAPITAAAELLPTRHEPSNQRVARACAARRSRAARPRIDRRDDRSHGALVPRVR